MEEAEPYSTCGRRYLVEYTGNGKCHLRALHNVNQDAAAEACRAEIKYTNDKGVTDVLRKNKHTQDSAGLVFRTENHWVAIESIKGTSEGMYYDDKILMKIRNYEGAVTCLELMHIKIKSKIERNFCLINVEENVSDETWSKKNDEVE